MTGFYGVRALGVEGFRGEVGVAFSCVFGVWGIVIGVEDAAFWRSDLLQELFEASFDSILPARMCAGSSTLRSSRRRVWQGEGTACAMPHVAPALEVHPLDPNPYTLGPELLILVA